MGIPLPTLTMQRTGAGPSTDFLPVGERRSAPTLQAITTVCFRVTRACNLRCGYCQAPPTTTQQTFEQLATALHWLQERGTLRVKFTGGEPFVYRRLLELIEVCRSEGMEPTIVTNGTILPSGALTQLQLLRARLKISLHGPELIHNRLQGRNIYANVMDNLRRLVGAGIETSVHTLIYHRSALDMHDWTRFLIREGVHKVSFMPFVPRGRGSSLASTWSLTPEECLGLRLAVAEAQDTFRGQIVVRYLDFLNQPYIVFETDGRLMLERSTEASDQILPLAPSVGSTDSTRTDKSVA